mgnify:CR=1 FL=1
MIRRTFLALMLAATPALAEPLVIEKQGSFFVGGEKKTVSQPGVGPFPAASGEITVNQMYVQYQIPLQGDRPLVEGACQHHRLVHALQLGLAEMMKVPASKVRIIWVEDAGSYGRAGYEDVAADAVVAIGAGYGTLSEIAIALPEGPHPPWTSPAPCGPGNP